MGKHDEKTKHAAHIKRHIGTNYHIDTTVVYAADKDFGETLAVTKTY